MNTITFVKLSEEAQIPSKDPHNAGLDVYMCFQEDYRIIPPHHSVLIPTGLASIIPEDYYVQIQERGSSGTLGLKYNAGVIDASYRGEWFLSVSNTRDIPFLIIKKEVLEKMDIISKEIIMSTYIIYPYEKALFQAIIHKVHNDIEIVQGAVEELEKATTSRGTGCLGSTNK